METVTVSKKFQVVIPEKLRKYAKISPGDKMVAIVKHGILQYVPMRSLKRTKGMVPGLDSKGLRDESVSLDELLAKRPIVEISLAELKRFRHKLSKQAQA